MIFTTNIKPVSENMRLIPAKTRLVASTDYRKAKEAIRHEFSLQHTGKPSEGPVEVLITCRPGRADLTAWNKMLCDCLNGIAYLDDKQIESITVEKTRDKTCPLVTVVVEEYHESRE